MWLKGYELLVTAAVGTVTSFFCFQEITKKPVNLDKSGLQDAWSIVDSNR